MTPEGISQLKSDEGERLRLYLINSDPTIGYGRDLKTQGISDDEADYLLTNDIEALEKTLLTSDWFFGLDLVRQDVILNMAYNLGLNGVLSFALMIAAIQRQDYVAAAAEIKNSRAAQELSDRYARLAQAMLTGTWSQPAIEA